MLPALSIAVTRNTLLPSELIVMVSPLATVPTHESTATLSPQENAAAAVEPSLYAAPWAGEVTVIVGGSFSAAYEAACVCGFERANVFVRLRCSLACAAVASPARL